MGIFKIFLQTKMKTQWEAKTSHYIKSTVHFLFIFLKTLISSCANKKIAEAAKIEIQSLKYNGANARKLLKPGV